MQMSHRWFAATLVAAILACGTPETGADAAVRADAQPAAPSQAEVPANETAAVQSGTSNPAMIRDVRINPGTTTVEIAFTSVPGAFASVTIGPTPPQTMSLHPALARESGPSSVLLLDPENQVAGYLVRSRTESYVLNTARDQPEEGSTNGPHALRPGTTYHFIISAPARAARPGEDEDDVPPGAQLAGTFTTRQ
jgi:hypothetical protein